MRVPLHHIAVTTAIALAAGCGAQEQTNASSSDLSATLEQIERESADPVYWLGSSFEGLRLTDAEAPRPAPSAGPTLTVSSGW